MQEVPIHALQDAIRNLHGCESSFVEAVPITETGEGKTVWDGAVQVFDLTGHPEATRCYAWSHYTEDDTERRTFVAVLHKPPVASPRDAVKAAVAGEHGAGDRLRRAYDALISGPGPWRSRWDRFTIAVGQLPEGSRGRQRFDEMLDETSQYALMPESHSIAKRIAHATMKALTSQEP